MSMPPEMATTTPRRLSFLSTASRSALLSDWAVASRSSFRTSFENGVDGFMRFGVLGKELRVGGQQGRELGAQAASLHLAELPRGSREEEDVAGNLVSNT